MNWKFRYALTYGDEHPSPELLGHMHRNIQSFYDAGGYIKMQMNSTSSPGPDSMGAIPMSIDFKAYTRDHKQAGHLGVGYLVHDPKVIESINNDRMDKYYRALDLHKKAVEEYEGKQNGTIKDPWDVDVEEDYKPSSLIPPSKPHLFEIRNEHGSIPNDLKYWAHPSINSTKLIPGAGTALQHALAVHLQPLGIGVDSGYAQPARKFHLNIGRRVDWTRGTGPGELDPKTLSHDGHGSGTSIWLPSDIEKIASLPIKNYDVRTSRVKLSNMYKYEEDDWNPDEVGIDTKEYHQG